MKPLIEIHDLTHKFFLGKNEVFALHKISLKIEQGEFVSLVGPSGSGKSTLLNLIGGLCRPMHGNIIINEQSLTSMSENQLSIFRRKHLGFIFQSFNLMVNYSALENVALPMTFSEVSSRERKKKAVDILGLVGLADRLDHKPGELSGGQQQRVSVARALVNEPLLVLADEPTGNLDSRTSKEIMDLLIDMNKKGQTFIMVTHDLEIARCANRIIHLLDGAIEKIEEN